MNVYCIVTETCRPRQFLKTLLK